MAFGEGLGRECSDASTHEFVNIARRMRMKLQAEGIAAGIMFKGRVYLARIVHRLSKCEVEVKSILVGQIGRFESAAHRFDIVLCEFHGLEVRETPPGF